MNQHTIAGASSVPTTIRYRRFIALLILAFAVIAPAARAQGLPMLGPIDWLKPVGGMFYIACASGGKVLTATGDGSNGVPIQLYPRTVGNEAQLWILEPLNESERSMVRISNRNYSQAFRIRNVKYGRYLDADLTGRHVDGKPVLLWEKATNDRTPSPEQQLWVITRYGGELFSIRNQISLGLAYRERVLDAEAKSAGNAGCPVTLWEPNTGLNQKWQLLPAVDFSKGVEGRVVALKASNGKYVCADANRGGTMVADRDAVGPWEKFWLIETGAKEYALFSPIQSFVCADRNNGGRLAADRFAAGEWEKFNYEDLGNGKIRLKGSNGKYVCADQSKGNLLVADRDQPGEWETFTVVGQ